MKNLPVILLLVILAGCGNPKPGGENRSEGKLELLLFAAPPCLPCKEELKKLPGLLASLGERETRVTVKVVVATGDTWSQPPTAESMEKYRKDVGVDFEMIADLPGGKKEWPIYKEYFPEWKKIIPAAVVLHPSKERKQFGPVPTYSPEELVDYLSGNLK